MIDNVKWWNPLFYDATVAWEQVWQLFFLLGINTFYMIRGRKAKNFWRSQASEKAYEPTHQPLTITESIFQRRFHGRRRCRIVLKVPISGHVRSPGHVQPCVKQKCLRSFTSNKTKNKMNYEKLLGWQVFKSRSQSVSIFLKFVHPRHLPGEGGGGTWVNFSLGMCHW